MAAFLKISAVRRGVRQAGKLCGASFITALDVHVNRLIEAAGHEKDGGRKTVDGELLAALLAKGVR